MLLSISDVSFKKTFCLMNICPQDLLSHEPSLWFGSHQLFWFRRTIFLRQQTATKSLYKCYGVKITVAALKLQVSGVVILSVQFLIHVSLSICIRLVWRICMMPDAFLMCMASAPGRVLAQPFRQIPQFPKRGSRLISRSGSIELRQTKETASKHEL